MTEGQGRSLEPHEMAAYMRALEARDDRREVGRFESRQGGRRIHREIHVVDGEMHAVEDIVDVYDDYTGAESPKSYELNQAGYNAYVNQPWFSRIFGG